MFVGGGFFDELICCCGVFFFFILTMATILSLYKSFISSPILARTHTHTHLHTCRYTQVQPEHPSGLPPGLQVWWAAPISACCTLNLYLDLSRRPRKLRAFSWNVIRFLMLAATHLCFFNWVPRRDEISLVTSLMVRLCVSVRVCLCREVGGVCW